MDFQIEEMRQQMSVLKSKLDKQEIVNESIIRDLIKKNVVNINRRYLIISALCLIMIPYSYFAFVSLNGMSIGFWAATSLMMLIVFIYTSYTGRGLRSDSLMNNDLIETRRKIAHAKKLDHDWLKIGLPLGLLWLCYFAYEAYRVYGGSELKQMVVVGVICGLVGAALGLRFHFRTQDKYNEILESIEEFTREG